MYKLHLDGGIFMENIYSDIAKRTDGDIYLGVVGPVRTGKSTFIKLIFHEETPNAGELIVNGFKLSHLKRRDIPKLRRTM